MAFSKKKRKEVYEKYCGRCAYCGSLIKYKDMQVDHVIPQHHYSEQYGCLIVNSRKFTDYGVHDMQNLKPACRICNKFKASFTLERFRSELQAQVERARTYSANFRMAEKFNLISIKNQKIKFYFEAQ